MPPSTSFCCRGGCCFGLWYGISGQHWPLAVMCTGHLVCKSPPAHGTTVQDSAALLLLVLLVAGLAAGVALSAGTVAVLQLCDCWISSPCSAESSAILGCCARSGNTEMTWVRTNGSSRAGLKRSGAAFASFALVTPLHCG
jgi:hypothetical protein